jgi:hypothetical protein
VLFEVWGAVWGAEKRVHNLVVVSFSIRTSSGTVCSGSRLKRIVSLVRISGS